MHATWYLFQFTRDSRAQEPRNLGLALHAPDGWHFHFRGVTSKTAVDARLIRGMGLDKDVYSSWISYYRRKALEGDWETALTLQNRRPSNFGVVTGGTIFEDRNDWDDIAFRMFHDLVSQPDTKPTSIVDEALRIFKEADIEPQRDIFLPGRWSDDADEVSIKFRFGVENGTQNGIDVARAAEQELSYMKTRMEAVSRVNSGYKTIAMLPLSSASDQDEAVASLLRTIETSSFALDIEDANAPQNLRDMLLSS